MDRVEFTINDAYPVILGDSIQSVLNSEIAGIVKNRNLLVCTTTTVDQLYAADVCKVLAGVARNVDLVVLDLNEGKKTLASVEALCSSIKAFGLGRRDILVALGGGVVSDVVRFASSIVRRGIGHICIPTTLIGQTDAGVGVKAAVNFNGGKSYLGTFYAPKAALVATDFLHTLPASAIRDGLAEVLKVALSIDCRLFDLVEECGPELLETSFARPAGVGQNIVERALRLTLKELELDLFERGSLKRLLDFGHSFSPPLEGKCGFTITHGQAVAIDICLSSAIAAELGLVSPSDLRRIIAVFQSVDLPCDSQILSGQFASDALDAAARHRDGSPNLVVPTGIGSATFLDRKILSPYLLECALGRLRAVITAMPVVTYPAATKARA